MVDERKVSDKDFGGPESADDRQIPPNGRRSYKDPKLYRDDGILREPRNPERYDNPAFEFGPDKLRFPSELLPQQVRYDCRECDAPDGAAAKLAPHTAEKLAVRMQPSEAHIKN